MSRQVWEESDVSATALHTTPATIFPSKEPNRWVHSDVVRLPVYVSAAADESLKAKSIDWGGGGGGTEKQTEPH